ncbi:MAG: multicopper oxidase family protein [Planctomycetaceae bacterium]
MDRRDFLRAAGAPAAAVAAGAAVQAQAPGEALPPGTYRRCEQLHTKLLPEEIDQFVVDLPLPPVVQTAPLGPGGAGPNPPVGAVAQGTAPEWFWKEGAGQQVPNQSQWGEQGAGRPDDIYRVPDVPVKYAEMQTKDFVTQVIPGWMTRLLGYGARTVGGKSNDPMVPGPTFEVRLGEPNLVRVTNNIDPALHLDISVHQHGGHAPAHSDGHANFLVLPAEPGKHPAESKDYYYPNPVPLKVEGELGNWRKQPGQWEFEDAPTTMWYHDHAEDLTAHNALMGLSGFFFLRDKDLDEWQQSGLLPDRAHEIPLVLRDACFCKITERDQIQPVIRREIDKYEQTNSGQKIRGEASLHFDPFDHNGTLGNIMLVNGAAYPRKRVAPEAYWLRMLNGALARFFDVEFWVLHPRTRQPKVLKFLRFGRDSWLFSKPREQTSAFLGMANRADICLDFSQFVDHSGWRAEWQDYRQADGTIHVYVVSTLNQKDGRGPGHGDNIVAAQDFPRGNTGAVPLDKDAPLFLMRFEVELPRGAQTPPAPSGGEEPAAPAPRISTRLTTDTPLRHFTPIELPPPGKIVVRELVFERGRGAWQINGRFYDSCIANAVPELWSTELWILKNKSGGWWHPIHLHLEAHQQIFIRGRNHLGERITLRRPDYHPELYEPFLKDDGWNETDAPLEEQRWQEAFGKGNDPDPQGNGLGFDSSVWDYGIKHDNTILGPNTEVHILMRFRTFQGPFVFHCHNLNHEDMRMMFQMDPRQPDSVTQVPDSQLKVRPDYWFFRGPEHCCQESKKVQS